MTNFEVFHPGAKHAVRVTEFVRFHGCVPEFAVYRPAYSSRGGCCNAVRLVRRTLEEAYRLAQKPLPQKVVNQWFAFGR